MLEEFVLARRQEIVRRCRTNAGGRSDAPLIPTQPNHGVPVFIDQLIGELGTGRSPGRSQIAETAAKHGHDLLRQGFTASQVVHHYGDICQVITEMLHEEGASVSAHDFRTFNRCLDDAIASAVMGYGDKRDGWIECADHLNGQKVRVLAHGIQLAVTVARIGFQAIRDGNVGVRGGTAALLERSLTTAEEMARSLEVALELEHEQRKQAI